jgi:hypothetical protein
MSCPEAAQEWVLRLGVWVVARFSNSGGILAPLSLNQHLQLQRFGGEAASILAPEFLPDHRKSITT